MKSAPAHSSQKQHMSDPPHHSIGEWLAAGPPDLLLVNAQVLTLEPGQPRAEAVAVRGDTIVAVGSQADVRTRAGPGARTIDCQGMCLLPGFVDAHCHLMALAASLQGLDCGPAAVSSLKELQYLLGHRAKETQPGRWIRGFGYDDLALAEGRHPTRRDLDEAAPQHPVRLDHRSGHATVLNSRGLRLAGIDRDAPDPPEGVIDRDGATGEPTGLLFELAGFLRQRLGSLRDAGQIEEGIVRLNRKLLGYGITSVQDASPDNDLARWETFAGLQDSGRLQIRVTMMAGAAHLNELLAEGRRSAGGAGGDSWLRLGHTKVMLTLTTGVLQPDLASLSRIVVEAHQAGFPVAIHAVEQEAVAAAARVLWENPFSPLQARAGDRAAVTTSPPVAALLPGDRIEHCAECPPELVTQVRKSRAWVVTQPGFVYWNGDRYRERVEESLLDHLYPIYALARAGVPVAFGSDAPVVDPNPWPAIYSAVTGATRGGAALSPAKRAGLGAGRGDSIQAALAMHTLAGARAEGSQSSKGTIRPGKLADLVLVDVDPTKAPVSALAAIRPVLTMLGGRVAWTDGQVGMEG